MSGGQAGMAVVRVVVMLLSVAGTTHQLHEELEEDRVLNRFVGAHDDGLSNAGNRDVFRPHSRRKRFIYPGTKWCGDGNIAENNDDLGTKVKLDRCCRQHDLCKDFIPANATRHGLHNVLPHTSSHCACDELFRECLHNVSNFYSGLAGSLYFDIARCFRYEYPARCARSRINNNRKRCVEYTYDSTKRRVWQFFDVLPWNSKPGSEISESDTTSSTTSAVYTTATAAQVLYVTSHAVKVTAVSSISLFTEGIIVTFFVWLRVKGPCGGVSRYRKLRVEEMLWMKSNSVCVHI